MSCCRDESSDTNHSFRYVCPTRTTIHQNDTVALPAHPILTVCTVREPIRVGMELGISSSRVSVGVEPGQPPNVVHSSYVVPVSREMLLGNAHTSLGTAYAVDGRA